MHRGEATVNRSRERQLGQRGARLPLTANDDVLDLAIEEHVMALREITVDLNVEPQHRWRFDSRHREAALDLTRVYNEDLGVDAETMAFVTMAASGIVPADLWAEIGAIAEALEVTVPEVVAGNLHYDMLKVVLGCTAFAVDSPEGPLHARNLDWWTTARLLNDATVVTRFVNGPCGEFVTVGWPGFVGAFSGVAPKRFAITLNAVLSDEAAQIAMPVVMLIRKVFEEARNFDEAVRRLSETPIATDCLLLVTGIKAGEMVVIERTPTKSGLRTVEGGEPLRTTNEYIKLDGMTGDTANELMRTSCGRYNRIGALVRSSPPITLDQCIEHLSDDDVKMGITVQQMAFCANSGELAVKIP